jgi:hypothetical protein
MAVQSISIAKFDTIVPVVIKDFHSNMPVKASFRTVNMGTTSALPSLSEIYSEWVQCDDGFAIVNVLVNSSKKDGLISYYFEWSMDGEVVHGKTMISEKQRIDYNHPSIPIRARFFRMIIKNEDTQSMDLDSYAYLTQ